MVRRMVRTAVLILVHVLMLLAVIMMWKPDAPPFIYVAF